MSFSLKKLTSIAFHSLVLSVALQASSSGAHWSYEGPTGPEFWHKLSPEFRIAKDGKEQSPVDLAVSESSLVKMQEINYKNTGESILNNGHTIQVNHSKGSYIKLDGKKFDLLQFHFHTPSENTINGKHSEMEMHLVHKSDDGQLAVVAVMIEQGKRNQNYESFRKQLPYVAHEHESLKETLNPASLLPNDKKVYRFRGSLTTPPCSENVLWNVMLDPVKLSSYQIFSFKNIMGNNNRPVQRDLISE